MRKRRQFSLQIFSFDITCTIAGLNIKLHKTFLNQVLTQHAHLSWPAVFSLILVTLTDTYVHSVGYACSVMPCSEIDVMCSKKCIMEWKECHACSSSSSAAIFQLF